LLNEKGGSKWARKYKDQGVDNFADKRQFNGAKPNIRFEKYGFSKFIGKTYKWLGY